MLSLKDLEHGLNQSFSDPAVAFLSQMHAVPAERSVLQVDRPAQIKVKKMGLAFKALFEHGLQRPLLLDVFIAEVRLGNNQDSFALFECQIGYIVNLLAIELPFCGTGSGRCCRRGLVGISERTQLPLQRL